WSELVQRGVLGFTGFQSSTAPVYSALDIAVHASTRPEPFGRSIVEAMATGKATVVANAGGAAELIRPGHDALAVPPGDVAALADAILRLAADTGLRQRLGVNARATVEERFNRPRLGREVLAFYQRL